MKKLFTLSVIVALTLSVFAQVPQKLSYQAVIRNATGGLVTGNVVGLKISILQGDSPGTPVYVETHTTTTNANGLATIQIGGGSVVSGAFATINWATGEFYLKTEADPAGGSSYTIIGISQLLSVPYALLAKQVEIGSSKWLQSGSDIYFNTGKVGIGIIPGASLRNFQSVTTDLQAVAGVNNSATYAAVFGENLGSGPAADFRNTGSGDGLKVAVTTSGKTGLISTAPNQGILGHAYAATGAAYGVQGTSASETGSGVTGYASSATGQNYGVRGLSASSNGTGVFGNGRYALQGETSDELGYGIYVKCTHPTGISRGINVSMTSPNGFSGYFSGGRFFVNGRIGFGTISPSAGLHLKAAGFPESFMFLEANTGQDAGFRLYEGATAKWHIFNNSAAGGLQIYNAAVSTAIFCDQATANVGIGRTDPGFDLDVYGNIRATGAVYYGSSAIMYNKPDYVFGGNYDAMQTEEVEEFLKKENHLPWITSARKEKEENGDVINMTRMAFETVESVENLQLQIIEQRKLIRELESRLKKLEKKERK